MSTSTAIHFWFEFASTYSYPAASRIVDVAARSHCRVVFRPFLLGPIFAAQGMDDSPFNLYPVKGRYMWRDLQRVCAALGLPFDKPSVFPRNGLLAARVACAADDDWLPAFVQRVYAANFVDDRDIADPAVVTDCLEDLAADPAAVLAAAASPQVKAALRSNTEQALAMGIFGAPTCSIDDELFWGNDRIEAAVQAAAARADFG